MKSPDRKPGIRKDIDKAYRNTERKNPSKGEQLSPVDRLAEKKASSAGKSATYGKRTGGNQLKGKASSTNTRKKTEFKPNLKKKDAATYKFRDKPVPGSDEKKQALSDKYPEKREFRKPSPDKSRKPFGSRTKTGNTRKAAENTLDQDTPQLIRLNRFLSNAGVCSRREADELIQAGVITVNGKVVTELGTKVMTTDQVVYGGQALKAEKLQYLLLNKPKGYLTTTDDPDDRKTIMSLIEGACRERVYPVGRLDRNTTGLLLLTNDGELAKKLMHPRFGIKKVYQVTLDKNLKKEDMVEIAGGVELEGERIRIDDIAYIGASKKEIGIEIHSGQNRVVRRIFEKYDYQVVKLDRTLYAGLTKKDLPRGKWRFLDPKEVSFLKMIK